MLPRWCRRRVPRATARRLGTLPFRIRAPLARLIERKAPAAEAFRAPALGDGEALTSATAAPDYLALALRSRVYDHLGETPLQHAPALSEALGASVHIKREDVLPGFTFYARCAVNELATLRASSGAAPPRLVTASIGSRGHALAWAADRLGRPFRDPSETLPSETLPSETLPRPFRDPSETRPRPVRDPSETRPRPFLPSPPSPLACERHLCLHLPAPLPPSPLPRT